MMSVFDYYQFRTPFVILFLKLSCFSDSSRWISRLNVVVWSPFCLIIAFTLSSSFFIELPLSVYLPPWLMNVPSRNLKQFTDKTWRRSPLKHAGVTIHDHSRTCLIITCSITKLIPGEFRKLESGFLSTTFAFPAFVRREAAVSVHIPTIRVDVEVFAVNHSSRRCKAAPDACGARVGSHLTSYLAGRMARQEPRLFRNINFVCSPEYCWRGALIYFDLSISPLRFPALPFSCRYSLVRLLLTLGRHCVFT